MFVVPRPRSLMEDSRGALCRIGRLLELSSVCIVDERGTIVSEAKVASEPEALIRYLHRQELPLTRVRLEAGPLSQWLHAGLAAAGFDTVLLEFGM